MNKVDKKSLIDAGPCEDGLAFALTCKDGESAWEKCQRPEWMVWAINNSGQR